VTFNLLLVGAIAAAAVLWMLVRDTSLATLHFGPSSQLIADLVADGEVIRGALERERMSGRRLPKTLGQLRRRHASVDALIECGRPGAEWKVTLLEGGGYEISLTHYLSWSSWDCLVYRLERDYPADWARDSRAAIEHDGWMYYVGAQDAYDIPSHKRMDGRPQ